MLAQSNSLHGQLAGFTSCAMTSEISTVALAPPDPDITMATYDPLVPINPGLVVSNYEPIRHYVNGSDPLVALTTIYGKQVLEHLMTGEAVQVDNDDGPLWKLNWHDGYGFLARPGDGDNEAQMMWVSKALLGSVWTNCDKIIVETMIDEILVSNELNF